MTLSYYTPDASLPLETHLLDGISVGEDEEGEAARPAGVGVRLHVHGLYLSELTKVVAQLLCKARGTCQCYEHNTGGLS